MARPNRDERQADVAAPLVFGMFLLAGASYILLAKLWLQVDPFLVTAVPCLLIIGYALLVFFSRRLRFREDQSADNFYYMGFIYTLVSLAASLYQYGAEGSLETIVRNFGVAIASTITGITLRIIFNQMRRDPVEVEHYSRLDLAEASARVRRELDGVEREFQHFRRANQQMLSESFTEVRQEVARSAAESMKASQTLAEQVLAVTKSSAESVQSGISATDLKAELDQTTKNLKRVTTALAKASDQIDKTTGAFASRIAALAPANEGLQPLIQSLDQSVQQLAQTVQQLGARLTEQSRIMDRVQAEMEQTSVIERNMARIVADETLGPADPPAQGDGPWGKAPEVVVDEKSASADR